MLLTAWIGECAAMPDEENPFVKMQGRTYAENWPELMDLYRRVTTSDSMVGYRLTEQIREVARQTGDRYWQLEADLFEINYRHREEAREKEYDTRQAITDIEKVAQAASAYGHPGLRLRALDTIIRAYLNILRDYEMAFEYAGRIALELEGVDALVYTDKLQAYRMLGDLYAMFGDLEKAAFFYAGPFEGEGVPHYIYFAMPAYANLGEIAREKDGDLATSDSLFRRVLELADEGVRTDPAISVWHGIAYSHLAYNRYLEKEYDRALPLYQRSMEIIKDFNDPHLMAGSAIRLADIYLMKNDLTACGHLLEQARTYIEASYQRGRFHEYYPVLSKYYAARGNLPASMIYLDSALIATEAHNKQFSSLLLLRAEQRAHRLEQKAHEEELLTERAYSLGYRRLALSILIGFVIVSILSAYLLHIYRRKQAAYRELVYRAQVWAVESTVLSGEKAARGPVRKEPHEYSEDEQSLQISQAVVRLMETEKIYLDPGLSLDNLAARLEINRSYLSLAINRCIGKKFTDYINEYRIREAIHLLNDPKSCRHSFDAIALDCGFNDRTTFYRAFKKITGLSPGDYRKNVG